MCLAVPMRIVGIDGFQCRCEAHGIERDVSLFMLQDQDIEVGDHVMVHVGYAIQKISPQQAQSTWALLDDALASEAAASARTEP